MPRHTRTRPISRPPVPATPDTDLETVTMEDRVVYTHQEMVDAINNTAAQFAAAYPSGTFGRLVALAACNSIRVNLMQPKLFRVEASLNHKPTAGVNIVTTFVA